RCERSAPFLSCPSYKHQIACITGTLSGRSVGSPTVTILLHSTPGTSAFEPMLSQMSWSSAFLPRCCPPAFTHPGGLVLGMPLDHDGGRWAAVNALTPELPLLRGGQRDSRRQ